MQIFLRCGRYSAIVQVRRGDLFRSPRVPLVGYPLGMILLPAKYGVFTTDAGNFRRSHASFNIIPWLQLVVLILLQQLSRSNGGRFGISLRVQGGFALSSSTALKCCTS